MAKRRCDYFLIPRGTNLATSSAHLESPEVQGFSTLPDTARRWRDGGGVAQVVSIDDGQRENDIRGVDFAEMIDGYGHPAPAANGSDYFLGRS